MDLAKDGLRAIADLRRHHLRRVFLGVRLDSFQQARMFYGVAPDFMAFRRQLLPFPGPLSPGLRAGRDEERAVQAVLLQDGTDNVQMSRHRIVKGKGDDGSAIARPGGHR